MALVYGVSCDHLKKVAAELYRRGYLETVRGRAGGFRLTKSPAVIGIGEVIRQTEGRVVLIEYFDARANTCPLISACQLSNAMREALTAFFAALDCCTLGDLIRSPDHLSPLLGLDPGRAGGGSNRRSSLTTIR